jgi:hypothetical protein
VPICRDYGVFCHMIIYILYCKHCSIHLDCQEHVIDQNFLLDHLMCFYAGPVHVSFLGYQHFVSIRSRIPD